MRATAKLGVWCSLVLVAGRFLDVEPARAAPSRAARAAQATLGLDFDDARRELELADRDDAEAALERGRLALYEGDCDGAATILARADVAAIEQAGLLAEVARGCARVTAATVVDRDEPRAVEIRYQDDGDRALTPFIVETVTRARDALTRDLGVTWPKPTRITVVRDLLSLSAMTGLPYQAAQTTGTVAVAKWGRVTLLSPRASHHGYVWRDTVAHELTHLAVTRATVDRAPLWLQEGVAKREETRWRPPGPFDDRPPADAVVRRGIELKLDLPLDRLGPSIAMLPSADQAMVAFGEVASFVRLLASTDDQALARLLKALRDDKGVDPALVLSTGSDLKAWDAKWRAQLAAKPREPLASLFGLGPTPEHVRDLRERARLAELLLGRNHARDALSQLEKIKNSEASSDPSLRYVRARALEANEKPDEAASLLRNPEEVLTSYGPWWAMKGRLARGGAGGAAGTSEADFAEAVGLDPLDVEASCQTLDRSSDAILPPDPSLRALCAAARALAEPELGRD